MWGRKKNRQTLTQWICVFPKFPASIVPIFRLLKFFTCQTVLSSLNTATRWRRQNLSQSCRRCFLLFSCGSTKVKITENQYWWGFKCRRLSIPHQIHFLCRSLPPFLSLSTWIFLVFVFHLPIASWLTTHDSSLSVQRCLITWKMYFNV